MDFTDLRGRRVTVMGLGRFGGGIGAARFLAERGARVTVTDLADEDSLSESLAALADVPIVRFRLGGHDAADFNDSELIVASPAVAQNHPLLAAAAAAGVPVTTEIGLFWLLCPAAVVAVTGSVGKSTTAAMAHAVLAASGCRAWLGGNIGGSLLADLDRMTPDDLVVLEVSSFQAERTAPLGLRPAVAVVTNLRPNHLDRHGSLAAYRRAKQSLLRTQTTTDVAVLNGDDPDVIAWPTAAAVWGFGDASRIGRGVGIEDDGLRFNDGRTVVRRPLALRIPGEHNRANAAAAATVGLALGLSPEAIVAALAAFRGLPHRLESLGEAGGRLWVNDSKATTPEAAIVALRAFDRPIRLIAGGADKGVDLTPLADAIAAQNVAAYLSGRTGSVIAEMLADRGAAAVFDAFDDAVTVAWAESRPGDVILLSPGCASYGQFRDYRERGQRFRALMERLAGAS